MLRELLKRMVSICRQEHPPPPCRLQGQVNLLERNGGRIEIHPTTLLNSRPDGYHVAMPFDTTLLADAPASLIRIGPYCRIHGTYIHAWDRVEIGQHVLIAAGTIIVDANGHSSNIRYARFRQNFRDTPKPIVIGDYAWIGMNTIILKGVEIGECAIVSAGSVVKESVPPFAVVEGNPARIIKTLEPDKALPGSYPREQLASEPGYFEY